MQSIIVAIVGRPNVGKSTIFNRLIGRRKAIVLDTPGVTRDLNYADTEAEGYSYTLVDTGGFEPHGGSEIKAKVREQAHVAIEEANVIIFVMNVREGLFPVDREIAEILRRSGKPVLYVVNKVDSERQGQLLADFYSIGVDRIIPVSAEHGKGIGELREGIVSLLPPPSITVEEGARTRVAIVGRPNAGKSSILNRLVGYERSVVSGVPGTTIDVLDTPLDYGDHRLLLIDTAGIRRKARISQRLEKYCVMEAIRAIGRCDVGVLVIDALEGVTRQDERIANLLYERYRGCIVAVNKWDLAREKGYTKRGYGNILKKELNFIGFAPIVYLSAKTGKNIDALPKLLVRVCDHMNMRVSTPTINRTFEKIVANPPPPPSRGRPVKIRYVTQKGTSPPTFIVFTNCPGGIKRPYERYLIGRIRESFGMRDVPVRLTFSK